MKKMIVPIILIAFPKIILSQSIGAKGTNDKFIPSVKIGNNIWMSRNLNVNRFRNGDLIPLITTIEEWKKAGESESPACC